MAKKKAKNKGKGITVPDHKKSGALQASSFAPIVLALGIIIAVFGTLTVPFFLEDDHLKAPVAIVCMVIGTVVALYGVKGMRRGPAPRRRK